MARVRGERHESLKARDVGNDTSQRLVGLRDLRCPPLQALCNKPTLELPVVLVGHDIWLANAGEPVDVDLGNLDRRDGGVHQVLVVEAATAENIQRVRNPSPS